MTLRLTKVNKLNLFSIISFFFIFNDEHKEIQIKSLNLDNSFFFNFLLKYLKSFIAD